LLSRFIIGDSFSLLKRAGKKMLRPIRVRFAPSPTGYLHLGNVRSALINFLFARQKKGSFILRIEDTDVARSTDEAGLAIFEDMKWLRLYYDEGPDCGGGYAPYLQSDRTALYQKHLQDLIEMGHAYRCFCSEKDLERMRQEQRAVGRPPRYDRRCLRISGEELEEKIAQKVSFLWRFRLNHEQEVEIRDMARGRVHFNLKHFSDFALTRADGSFTFTFTNFVDDWLMEISHVIRGDDHLTNSAMQAALFHALAIELPTFWHLPMLCDVQGKKLSKREAGFSVNDLRDQGYLPEAICNYLAVVGGTFEKELQSLDELVTHFDFKNIHATGSIHYDKDKLRWFNHKWIERISLTDLVQRARPFIQAKFPACERMKNEELESLLKIVKTDLKTLADASDVLRFYFERPALKHNIITKKYETRAKDIFSCILESHAASNDKESFLQHLKINSKNTGLKFGQVFSAVRYLLTGNFQGLAILELLTILSWPEVTQRLHKIEGFSE